MTWTRARPTKAGWYFYRENAGEEYVLAVNAKLMIMVPTVPNPIGERGNILQIHLNGFTGDWSREPITPPTEAG